jgi:hypothetical protein
VDTEYTGYQAIYRIIEPDEQVLWVGRPQLQHATWWQRTPAWTLFLALFVGSLVVSVLLSLLLNTFCCITLLVLPGFFIPFGAYTPTSDTVYALTSQRALIARASKPEAARSIFPAEVAIIRVSERHAGRGDLLFVQQSGIGFALEWLPGAPGFYAIDEVRRVEQMARRVLRVDDG